MSAIPIPVGNVLLAWSGPVTTLAGQPWFTPANINGIYKLSSNGLGFISSKPGAAFPGFTTLQPAASGSPPQVYIFNVKASFSLDSSLLGDYGRSITVSPASLSAFTADTAAPSASQSFVVAGNGLTADMAITSDSANFQVSFQSSTNFSGSKTIAPTSGTVANTTVYARLTSGTAGTYSGTITISSAGAVSQTVAVSGTVSAAAAPALDFSTLTFAKQSTVLISDPEPAVWRVKDLDFATPPAASELLIRAFPPPVNTAYEAEDGVWARVGNWQSDSGSIYHNGAGLYTSTAGGTLTRTLTATTFTLYAPTTRRLACCACACCGAVKKCSIRPSTKPPRPPTPSRC